MAVGLVSATETASISSGVGTLTFNKPASVAAGDVLICGITSDSTTPTAPSGWVEFGGGLHPGASWNNRLYYRIVTGSEGSTFSWTVGTVGPASGYMNAWNGCNTSASPISNIAEESVDTSGEPNTGPSVAISDVAGRLIYVRHVRDSASGSAAASNLTTAAVGVTRRASLGSVSTSGNTAYSASQFSNDSNFSGAATYPGIAISSSITEENNYEATFALKAQADPATGTLTSQVPSITSQFAGTRVMPDGPIAAQVPSVSSAFVGTAAPPEGPLDVTLPMAQAAFEASGVGGAAALTLPSITSDWLGGVEPIGTFAGTLPSLTSDFLGETRPFGEQVIVVEAEKRGFRITQDDTVPIYLNDVTDA